MLIFSDIALSMGQILNVSAWFCEKTEQFLHQVLECRLVTKSEVIPGSRTTVFT